MGLKAIGLLILIVGIILVICGFSGFSNHVHQVIDQHAAETDGQSMKILESAAVVIGGVILAMGGLYLVVFSET